MQRTKQCLLEGNCFEKLGEHISPSTSTPSLDLILPTTRPFDLADESERARLIAASELFWVRANHSIHSRGARMRTVHLVVSGKARVGALSAGGAEMVFHFVGPGRL